MPLGAAFEDAAELATPVRVHAHCVVVHLRDDCGDEGLELVVVYVFVLREVDE